MDPGTFEHTLGTLVVGALGVALCLGLATAYLPARWSPWSVARRLLEGHGAYAVPITLALLVAAFATGILAEGIVRKGSEATGQGSLWGAIARCQIATLGDESHHRFLALYRSDDARPGYHLPTGLGSKVMSNRAYRSLALGSSGDDGRRFADGWESVASGPGASLPGCLFSVLGSIALPSLGLPARGYRSPRLTDEKTVPRAAVSQTSLTIDQGLAESMVSQLYDPAESWAHSVSTHAAELQGMQRRADWARGSFMLASWALLLISVPLIGRCVGCLIEIAATLIGAAEGPTSGVTSADDLLAVVREALAKSGVIPTVVISLFAWIVCTGAASAYANVERVIGERTFGYYSSHLERGVAEVATEPQPPPRALLWMRTSAEYEALCHQAFNAAMNNIRAELERLGTAKGTAVVMDLDETVFDNLHYETWLREQGWSHEESAWAYWNNDHHDQIKLIPGSKRFIGDMRLLGVRVVFISNRSHELTEVTEKVLRELGIVAADKKLEEDGFHMFLQTKTGSKKARRRRVESELGYNVLAYFGDNLADFYEGFEVDDESTAAPSGKKKGEIGEARRRYKAACEAWRGWGDGWYVLPNPRYGAWTDAIAGVDSARLMSEEFDFRCDE